MRPRAERSPAPEISIIIPTYQRRDAVLALLRSLADQELGGGYEVLVVVDGSTDGTLEAIRAARFPFPLLLLAHGNRGAAATRNRGARNSRGKILLFLDDDMEAEAGLLDEHLRSHGEGADVVLGSIPLHPASPDTLLSQGVGRWAEKLHDRLAVPGHRIGWEEIFSGQMSVRREVFEELGGFDERFTRRGGYGNEDLDFAYRLVRSGRRVVFNPRAVSHQRYTVDGAANLRQWRRVGRADVALARKHPEIADRLFELHQGGSRRQRLFGRAVLATPRLSGLLGRALARIVVARLDSGRKDALTRWAFQGVRGVEYWRGVREAGGIPRPRSAQVLCYHALSDLSEDPVLAEYGIPVRELALQLRELRRSGHHFVSPDEFLDSLRGRGHLPRGALLLTFDDGYADLAEALPILDEEGIRCVVFAVSQEVGGSNRWDRQIGARELLLMDAAGLRRLVSEGHEIGAHGRTHRMLTRLSRREIDDEIEGALEDLRRMGFEHPRFFSYPHGEHNEQVRQAARRAGVEAAFTVAPGAARPGTDAWAVPRIEILRRDRGWRLRLKLALARR